MRMQQTSGWLLRRLRKASTCRSHKRVAEIGADAMAREQQRGTQWGMQAVPDLRGAQESMLHLLCRVPEQQLAEGVDYYSA